MPHSSFGAVAFWEIVSVSLREKRSLGESFFVVFLAPGHVPNFRRNQKQTAEQLGRGSEEALYGVLEPDLSPPFMARIRFEDVEISE